MTCGVWHVTRGARARQVRGAVSGGFPYQSSGVRLDFLQPYLLDKWSLHACLAQTSKLVPRPKKLAQLLQSVSVTVEQVAVCGGMCLAWLPCVLVSLCPRLPWLPRVLPLPPRLLLPSFDPPFRCLPLGTRRCCLRVRSMSLRPCVCACRVRCVRELCVRVVCDGGGADMRTWGQREGRHAWTYELSSRRLDLCRDAAPDEAADSAGWTAADLASLKSGASFALNARASSACAGERVLAPCGLCPCGLCACKASAATCPLPPLPAATCVQGLSRSVLALPALLPPH